MLETLTSFVHDAGPLAPVIYILLFLMTALLPFIPTPLISTIGGTLLGAGPAIGYGVIGLGLGAALALNLARHLGRPLVLRLVKPEVWSDWEQLLGIKSLWVWGAIFFILNVDFAVMAAGLSSLSLVRLWLTAMIARLPWIIGTAYFGDLFVQSDSSLVPALVLGLVLLVLLRSVSARLRHLLAVKVPEVVAPLEEAGSLSPATPEAKPESKVSEGKAPEARLSPRRQAE